jgi:hypothetical protein
VSRRSQPTVGELLGELLLEQPPFESLRVEHDAVAADATVEQVR